MKALLLLLLLVASLAAGCSPRAAEGATPENRLTRLQEAMERVRVSMVNRSRYFVSTESALVFRSSGSMTIGPAGGASARSGQDGG
ncbi:MAG TPA: hypothetical protein VEX38_07420, partial [Fimbriimonadaceae bacterium]|nr:hypothetical protein [Fimbriimonadaceae bacterium]